jgi:hypothetical protein
VHSARQGKDRFGKCRQAKAQYGEQFAFSEVVADCA